MKFLLPTSVRELENRLCREQELSLSTLVGRAARGLAVHLCEIARAARLTHPRVWLLAGKGNNGADASALACILHGFGWSTELWLAASADSLTGAARENWDRAVAAGVRTRINPDEKDWVLDGAELPLADILVDGLLGTATKANPTGAIAAAIQSVGRVSDRTIIVSIDLPSGLDGQTGIAYSPCVRASLTLCTAAPKSGMSQPASREFTGPIEHVGIGLPADWVEVASKIVDQPLRMITRESLAPLFPARHRDSHKGHYGRLLLIGGSRGMTGAIGLAARAAVRSGVGLVTVLTPAALVPIVAALCPEAMVHPAPENEEGSISSDVLGIWQKRLDEFDAIVAGPGMGNTGETMQLIRRIFTGFGKPILLDADAITCFEGRAHWMEKSAGPVVITPHPGEASRLLGWDVPKIQADRLAAARQVSASTGAIVALKGSGTLVTRSTGDSCLNLNGNPGMATGGTGDVLAGLLGGLLARRMDPFQATCAAVYLHGLPGDLAAFELGESGLTASAVIEQLPAALRAAGA